MSADKNRGKGKSHDDDPPDELRADRETNYAQGSWIGGGRIQTMLSAERLSDAFASDPDKDPPHDGSWHTHKVEEDDRPQPSDDSHDARK